MTQDMTFTDEQLTTYLDGEAEAALRAQIDRALVRDGVLADRLSALSIDKSALVAAFDGVLAQAPQMPDFAPTPRIAAPANMNAKPGLIGGIMLFGTGLAAGLVLMMVLETAPPEPKAPGWKAVVASYQSLYSNETLVDQSVSPAETATQLAKMSTALGADVTTLPELQGLDFKRAQLLDFNGKPLIQIAFARADGTPVALCIIRAKSTDAKAMASETIQGMAAASWNNDGFAYLLIGGDQPALTAQEAQAFERWAGTVTSI